MTPRSPSGSGGRVSMPAADFVMQRNVPIRLMAMMRSKFSSGNSLISPVALSRDTVLALPPVPAQLTRMRSCPFAPRALAKAASTAGVAVTSASQNTPPISRAIASPRSSLTSKIATFTPWEASIRAVAAPSPDAPPVTTAEMLASSFILALPARPDALASPGGNLAKRHVLVHPNFRRQAEDALRDDVAHDLVGAAGDAQGRRVVEHLVQLAGDARVRAGERARRPLQIESGHRDLLHHGGGDEFADRVLRARPLAAR